MRSQSSEWVAPIAALGVVGAIVAFSWVMAGWPFGRLLAGLEGGGVAIGFIAIHGLPIQSSFTKPYWGKADPLQWLIVVANIVVGSALVVVAARGSTDAVQADQMGEA